MKLMKQLGDHKRWGEEQTNEEIKFSSIFLLGLKWNQEADFFVYPSYRSRRFQESTEKIS